MAAKKSFYDLAKSRVKVKTREAHEAFYHEIHGESSRCGPAFAVLERVTGRNPRIERRIVALEISVDETFFNQRSADLMPYIIEHEIYELWLSSKRGYAPKDRITSHMLARRREFDLATKDGNAERLLEFCKNISPAHNNELDYAYQKARAKHLT